MLSLASGFFPTSSYVKKKSLSVQASQSSFSSLFIYISSSEILQTLILTYYPLGFVYIHFLHNSYKPHDSQGPL